ncbi:MAG: bifunctional phosphoribosylaminoimidazolecarboxamide formyltransferase/IMP cyclohydrolase [Bacilli bacterium]|jgi:phosphoribosylaminoimidazolecarboxamide formyltransferase/IMP cyclohydrolase|nr:bifunctional phosphoribosylaminoimidazolecarboxamide formyltransferase/IMP cyclohydrolase [Bacilli bacterium]
MNKKNALISLTNKDKLEELVSNLIKNDYQIVATTSTAQAIKDLGYECQLVEDIAHFPEILNGRVKTLQPEIHGGILADLNNDKHLEDLSKYHLKAFSLVVCNLYEFEKTLKKEDEAFKDKLNNNSKEELEKIKNKNIIESIDIGGITLIRAASKNYEHVSILCNPEDYDEFIERLNNDEIDYLYNQKLACKGFIHTANYDSLIANYFMKITNNDDQLLISAPKMQELRYGENPHQQAQVYLNKEPLSYSINTSNVIQGKELSYNNMVDVDTAYQLIMEYDINCAVAIKHATPCGIGWGKDIEEAYDNCFKVDSKSIFGGIVILNNKVTKSLAKKLTKIFLEIVIAPSYEEDALEIFKAKKNLRIIKGDFNNNNKSYSQTKSIRGAYLVQTGQQNPLIIEQVTHTKVDLNTQAQLNMLNKVVKHVKSNAIVIGQNNHVLGICGGMVNRIDAAKYALNYALNNINYHEDEVLLLASDGFFPFNDIVELCIENNIKFIIQPGGSLNDEKMIEACDQAAIGMVFTKQRFFRH